MHRHQPNLHDFSNSPHLHHHRPKIVFECTLRRPLPPLLDAARYHGVELHSPCCYCCCWLSSYLPLLLYYATTCTTTLVLLCTRSEFSVRSEGYTCSEVIADSHV